LAILPAILNSSKASMVLTQHHLDYLTLKHHPTTKVSIKQLYTKHQLHKYRSFKKRISAAILAAILWFFMMSARHYSKYFTAAHPLTESTLKTYAHYTFYIKIDLFQKKSHFGCHLGSHLEFLETLNDASPASFRIFHSNMSSNRIINKKTLYTPMPGQIRNKQD